MKNRDHPANWKFTTPENEGFFQVITPENSACKITWIFRLNLKKGNSWQLSDKKLEMNGVIIQGKITIRHNDSESDLQKFDSFYIPANEHVTIQAKETCSIFIGGSLYEGKGSFFTRKYNLLLPIGDIHQIHGKPPYRREVFMTLAQQDAGSRLICGITMGDPGAWTSWPPHQHTKDMEEVYCYFDIPKPRSAFHFASRNNGEFEFIHPVSSGNCVIIPEGYHPTCGMPGVKSCYFWVMSAHSPDKRRYDLAVNDPNFEE